MIKSISPKREQESPFYIALEAIGNDWEAFAVENLFDIKGELSAYSLYIDLSKHYAGNEIKIRGSKQLSSAINYRTFSTMYQTSTEIEYITNKPTKINFEINSGSLWTYMANGFSKGIMLKNSFKLYGINDSDFPLSIFTDIVEVEELESVRLKSNGVLSVKMYNIIESKFTLTKIIDEMEQIISHCAIHPS